MSVLVFLEHHGSELQKGALGVLGKAATLGDGEVAAVLIGGGVKALATEAGAYGATKVFRAEGPEGLAQPVVDALEAVIEANGHNWVLLGGGLLSFEIGAGLAARRNAGVVMEVVNVKVEDGRLVSERSILGDSQISQVRYEGDLGIVIGRLNAFDANESGGTAQVEQPAMTVEGPVADVTSRRHGPHASSAAAAGCAARAQSILGRVGLFDQADGPALVVGSVAVEQERFLLGGAAVGDGVAQIIRLGR